MGNHEKKPGEYGETIAAQFLTEIGFEIVKRNYRYGHGEIDIIALEEDILVFVEVKSRKNLEYGKPEDAITVNKIKQIRHIASAYIYENNLRDQNCRFDFVGILLRSNLPPEIVHYRNAF